MDEKNCESLLFLFNPPFFLPPFLLSHKTQNTTMNHDDLSKRILAQTQQLREARCAMITGSELDAAICRKIEYQLKALYAMRADPAKHVAFVAAEELFSEVEQCNDARIKALKKEIALLQKKTIEQRTVVDTMRVEFTERGKAEFESLDAVHTFETEPENEFIERLNTRVAIEGRATRDLSGFYVSVPNYLGQRGLDIAKELYPQYEVSSSPADACMRYVHLAERKKSTRAKRKKCTHTSTSIDS